MTQAELHQALKTLGLAVAYSAFKGAVTPPFITYEFSGSDDLMADNQNYVEISNFQVELYSKAKDLANEASVQDLLKSLRLPYRKHEAFIESEGLRQVVYEVQAIGG